MFRKKLEDFACEKCGALVSGDGFTNHCPRCLWSKHVDIEPGDRAADCGGMMRPVTVEKESGEFILTHRCEKCGHEKRNRTHKDDDFDRLVDVSKTVD